MRKLQKTRRFITLVEIMIVMFLIAMITGVIAYNYTGSLDEGKAFKTKTAIDKIHTILDLHLAANPEDRDNIETNWKEIVGRSQMVKNAKDLTNDGWGNEYRVTKGNNEEIVIESEKYNAYRQRTDKSGMFNK